MPLTARKEQVLESIVIDFIHTADPVGSRTISKKYDLGVSAATIRNEMADLEEMGYIIQPHTSAGRVPSDLGYRYYVDHLMQRRQASSDAVQELYRYVMYSQAVDDQGTRNILRKLAELTGYTVMCVLPEAHVNKPLLALVQLIYLSPGRAIMLVVSDDERIDNRMIDVPDGFGPRELHMITEVFNHYLRGLSVEHWHEPLIQYITGQMGSATHFITDVLELLNDVLNQRKSKKIYVEGVLNILEQPEFKEVPRIKEIFSTLQTDAEISEIMSQAVRDGIEVRIGQENSPGALQDCSLVTANYRFGKRFGQMGILGPTRMAYDTCVSLLETVLHAFEKIYISEEETQMSKSALSRRLFSRADVSPLYSDGFAGWNDIKE